jgi:hypothetical protein
MYLEQMGGGLVALDDVAVLELAVGVSFRRFFRSFEREVVHDPLRAVELCLLRRQILAHRLAQPAAEATALFVLGIQLHQDRTGKKLLEINENSFKFCNLRRL